jgi:hypothetical protein
LERNAESLDVRIDWRVIRADQIAAYSSGRRMGLQIADAVASSFFYAVNPSRLGFTEDRYARMLKPVVYNREGRYLGYGIKLFPKEVGDQVGKDNRFNWIVDSYQ